MLLMLTTSLSACGGGGHAGSSNKIPVARMTVAPVSGPTPLAVTVSAAASTDKDGTISTYSWAFGDGANATGVSAAHTYATAGEFFITLTVTDNKGATGTTQGSVVATGPTAVYNASAYDGTSYQDEPPSGTLDATPLQ
jgi:PKD repeat protein